MPPGGKLSARIKKAIIAAYRLSQLSKDADLIIPVTPAAAIVAWAACIFQRNKVVPWVHYDRNGIERDRAVKGRKIRDFLQKVLYTAFVPSFKRLIFVSESSRLSFSSRRRGGRVPPEWIILPNPFDEAPFLPAVPSRTFGAAKALRKTGKPLLLFLGRLFRQKRWEDAILVAERLAASGFDCNIAFVGNGVDRDHFLERLRRSACRRSMHYLGPDFNVRPTLELADGLLMTSLFEAWPTVILEAFAVGVPVFAYDCPSGPSEMLVSRGVVTEESPDDMANKIIAYFSSTEDEKRRSQQKARLFADAFRAEHVVPAWEPALLMLTGQPRNH